MKKAARRGPPRALAPRSAAEAIAAALAFHGVSDEVRARTVLAEWRDLVGPRIAARTRPHGVFERVLVVEVATSAWLHELTMLRPQLLSGLLERVGEPRLFDDLKLVLAGRTRGAPTVPPRPRAPPAAPPREPAVRATGAARDAILREVDGIADPDLRELVARVRITYGK